MKYVKTVSIVLAVLFTATLVAGQPQLIPAAKKYSDTGAKPATGRAGSATVSARALLGADQVTTLDVSTGAFNAGAPGNLDKLQVKLTHGRKQQTSNFNNLSSGGFVSLPFEGLFRNDAVQVQANVSGIDPNRTGVVTVTAPVWLRPDLQVTGISAPAEARADEPVTIIAHVAETNGDLGAAADVVVEVDGVEVDRSSPFVDRADSVEILFTHVFDSDGEKTITISARNVDPADYDLSNNSFSVKILIKSTLPFRTFTLTAMENEFSSTTRTTDATEDRTTTQSGYQSSANFIGFTEVLNLATTKMTVQHFSGTLACQATFLATPAAAARGAFALGNNGQTATFTPTFRFVGGVKVPETKIQIVRSSANVMYFSNGWSYRYPGKSGTYYVFNESRQLSLSGAQGRYGSVYEIEVEVNDGANTFGALGVAPLSLKTTVSSVPKKCFPSGTFGPYCTESNTIQNILSGSYTETNY